ncbi:MAG: lysophospholipase [Deltaproteobacteria bacterium]|nr:lysophospholipase [Deltaproteobacteria bacterium]
MRRHNHDGQWAVLSRFPVTNQLSLYYEWWVPAAPKGILLVAHGIGEHSGRYGPFARAFYHHGFAVALFDQRGHGQSDGPRGELVHIQEHLGDLAAFVQLTRERFPHLPMFLVGHSFGGQLALNFVVRYSKGLRGLILSSPNIGLKLQLSWWQQWLCRVGSRWMPSLPLRDSIRPEWLSHDPAIVEQYRRDPRVVRVFTVHAVMEVLRNLDIVMALAPRIHLPSLFLHAGDDRICDPDATRRFYRRVPVGYKRLKIYDGFYHELFNEVEKGQVFRDIVQWIDEYRLEELRPLPGVTQHRTYRESVTTEGATWSGSSRG